MDLYGQKSPSIPQKSVILGAELALLVLSYAILFSDALAGVRWSGHSPLTARGVVLFAFNVVLFGRRRIPWEEAFTVPLAFALYLVGIPLLARGSDAAFGWLDVLGILLFAVGSVFNTLSELQRKRFKAHPENSGKLFTGGLFALCIHVNYFGDLLWVTGMAAVTHNPVALAIPLILFCFFAFYNVPKLDAHLREHYGEDFAAYERRTKRLIPFLY
jgi:protein-S-isoprenylcysteine O-methyltransferase Ste14